MAIVDSCVSIQVQAGPVMDGTYLIDPEGDGSPIEVLCDMKTDGGGWTVIFLPPKPNMMSTNIGYTVSSPTLREGDCELLLGYRDSDGVLFSSAPYAIMDQPDNWQDQSPFKYYAMSAPVTVSASGDAPVSAELYYGYSSWDYGCADWNDSVFGPNGKICIVSSKETPAYFHWARDTEDLCQAECCPDSGTYECTAGRQFSIAIRRKCSCEGKECGNDGCGGSCGDCEGPQDKCVDGLCACQPACDGKACGPDGCGSTCGECNCGSDCKIGLCFYTACDGKECGGNGCGASCGSCLCGEECLSGTCTFTACDGKECGVDGCSGSCGHCGCGEECSDGSCDFVGCEGVVCGDDGCGGSCGECECGENCIAGTCSFTACDDKECGDDGCDGTCGECLAFPKSFCNDAGHCDCVGNCEGTICGYDGCGGICGSCGCGEACVQDACSFVACAEKECGDDGCGGTCGECPEGQLCNEGKCMVGVIEQYPAISCLHVIEVAGAVASGEFWLDPDGDGQQPFLAYCDMEVDGGGWTKVLHYPKDAAVRPCNYDSFSGELAPSEFGPSDPIGCLPIEFIEMLWEHGLELLAVGDNYLVTVTFSSIDESSRGKFLQMLYEDQGAEDSECAILSPVGSAEEVTLHCYGTTWPSAGGGNVGLWDKYILVGVGGAHSNNKGNNLSGLSAIQHAASYFVR